MITLKSEREIEEMEKSGALLAEIHRNLRTFMKPGMSTWEVEVYVRDYIESHDGIAAQIGFEGYKYATCISVNDEICHGMPKKSCILKDEDVVKVDMCIDLHGAMSDSCWTYVVGKSTPEIDQLMEVTKEAMYRGIAEAKVGNRIGDIGHAIQVYAESFGYGVVEDYLGHGIGPTIHERPMVPSYGEAHKGARIKEGMTITIEPMLNIGSIDTIQDNPDGWTVRTLDGSLSAQYEHTVAITKDGPVILTGQGDE